MPSESPRPAQPGRQPTSSIVSHLTGIPMAEAVPEPIPYRSKMASNDPEIPRITIQAALALAFLVAILCGIYAAFWHFAEGGHAFRGLLRSVLQLNEPSTSSYRWSVVSVGDSLPGAIDQLAFAAAFGLLLPAVLFHWRRQAVCWFALAVPITAGLWNVMMTILQSSYPMDMFAFICSCAIEAAVVYFSATQSRRVAIWLAGLLLPPQLAESLQTLWRHT